MTYSDPDLVEVVYHETVALRDGPPPGLDALSCRIATALLARPRVVFDIGGACGASYFRLRSLITWDVEWHVVETAAMAARAADRDEMPAVAPDLLLASGVLQFMPVPLGALRDWVDRGASWIMLSQTPLADHAVSLTQRSRLADNEPGPLPPGFKDREVTYPMTAAPRREVEAILTSRYDLTPFPNDDRGPRTRRFQPTITMHGWLGRLRP